MSVHVQSLIVLHTSLLHNCGKVHIHVPGSLCICHLFFECHLNSVYICVSICGKFVYMYNYIYLSGNGFRQAVALKKKVEMQDKQNK